MKKDYIFSFVIAVYNVESYLAEAIESLIVQTVGFGCIQVILVDDGSTDGSLSVCHQYAKLYPDNITVIHQSNAGVSAARNAGLQHVRGRYVSFMDADDKLTSCTCSHVKAFFDAHGCEVDLVAIPMVFFDGGSGGHVLNVKFQKGTRVISLDKEWDLPQLSMSSAFVKVEALAGLEFDTRLRHLEDMKIVQQILLSRMAYGVVADARYWYRRRKSGQGKSAVQSAAYRHTWYVDTLAYAEEELLNSILKDRGHVPRYVQYAVMYDLQWRLSMEDIPPGVLTAEEIIDYRKGIARILLRIEDQVIDAQRNIYSEYKLKAKAIKYGADIDIAFGKEGGIAFVHKGIELFRASSIPVKLEFLWRSGEELVLDFCALLPCIRYKAAMGFFCMLGNRRLNVKALQEREATRSMGEPALAANYYRCVIPLADIPKNGCGIRFYAECSGHKALLHKLMFNRFFPISQQYRTAYWHTRGFTVSSSRKEYLWVEPTSLFGRMRREKDFLVELWKKNQLGARKAVVVRLFVNFIWPLLKRRSFWLISDRAQVAGDNGEAFFRYMVENHPEQKVYFCINSKSVHYKTLRKVGPVLKRNGIMYKLRVLVADWLVSSQAEEQVTNPFWGYSDSYKDLLANHRYVFLGHGVTQNDLSSWLGRYKKDITGIVAASAREAEAFCSDDYGYAPDNVWLVGLPRHDRLYHDEQRQILIMPTWRRELMSSIDSATGVWKLADGFMSSNYYVFYNSLINNKRLLNAAQELGYTIVFLPHPNLRPYLELFDRDPRVVFAGADLSYRMAFAQGNVLVTDYSSVAFDFAYLRKPIFYSQFDKEDFYARTSVVKPGYFDYDRDGFGPVVQDAATLVSELIDTMKNKCRIKDIYLKRIDDFFAFSDAGNCRRLYDKMIGVPCKRT